MTVPYSAVEMKRVLDPELYWDDPNGERNRLIVELFYGCGLRCSELCGLRTNDLSADRGTIKVHGKGNKERLVPLHKRLGAALAAYAATVPAGDGAKAPFLFAEENEKLSRFVVYRIINKYLGLATRKVKKSPHVLRHTFATHLLEEGADISSVKELLGHASLASTQIYTHTSLGKLKSVYNRAHPRGGRRSGTGNGRA